MMKAKTPSVSKKDWFKRHQKDGIYHYYEVYGGRGKTKDGFQVVVNFLNERPIVTVAHNYQTDPSGLTGTWCTYEVGIPISEEEYLMAYKKATDHPDVAIL